MKWWTKLEVCYQDSWTRPGSRPSEHGIGVKRTANVSWRWMKISTKTIRPIALPNFWEAIDVLKVISVLQWCQRLFVCLKNASRRLHKVHTKLTESGNYRQVLLPWQSFWMPENLRKHWITHWWWWWCEMHDQKNRKCLHSIQWKASRSQHELECLAKPFIYDKFRDRGSA